MKKLVFTIALVMSITIVFASQLSIRMYNNAPVFMVLDGYNRSGLTSQHTFLNLIAGKHYLEIYAPAPYAKPAHLLFSGIVQIAPNVKIRAMIDRFYSFIIIEMKYLNTPHHEYYRKRKWEENYYYNEGHDNYDRYEHRYGMKDRDFDYLMESLYKTSFDNTRLTIAKSALRENNICCDQLLKIMNTFTFESNKLEIAKAGWHSVVDRERFYIIYSAFTFKSSIDEIENYIQTH